MPSRWQVEKLRVAAGVGQNRWQRVAAGRDRIDLPGNDLPEGHAEALAGTARQVRRLVKAAQAAEGGEPRIASSGNTERRLESVLPDHSRH